MKNKILGLLILTTIIQSCETKTERQKDIEKLKDNSIEILAKLETEIKLSEINNTIVWKVNLDSIQSEWQKIHKDSAELGLIFLKKFDSIYKEKSSELKAKAEIEETKAEIEKEKLLAKSKEKLKKLKRKFTYKKDEFQDIGFYTHKRWGEYWPNRKH